MFLDIPDEVIIARGQYATVRAALEDALKAHAKRVGDAITQLSHINNTYQSDEVTPDAIYTRLRELIDTIERESKPIEELRELKRALKEQAWA